MSKQRFKLWGKNISIQEKQAMSYQYSLCKEYWRGVFYRDRKLMHVAFYRCFDALLDSWIINEFLNRYCSQRLGCKIQTILSCGIFTKLVSSEEIQFWFLFLYKIWTAHSWRFSRQNGGLYAIAQRSPCLLWFRLFQLQIALFSY